MKQTMFSFYLNKIYWIIIAFMQFFLPFLIKIIELNRNKRFTPKLTFQMIADFLHLSVSKTCGLTGWQVTLEAWLLPTGNLAKWLLQFVLYKLELNITITPHRLLKFFLVFVFHFMLEIASDWQKRKVKSCCSRLHKLYGHWNSFPLFVATGNMWSENYTLC